MLNQNFTKSIFLAIFFIFSPFLASASVTLTPQPIATNIAKREYVQFSIENDMSSEFFYYLGGTKNTIDRAAVRTFNFPEGTELYFWENGKGKLWLKIDPKMNKQSFQLSKLLQH